MGNKESAYWWVMGFTVIALIGFSDAVYMTLVHFQGDYLVCTVLKGCDLVALSPYSTIGTTPVAMFGAIYYFFMLIAGLGWFFLRNPAYFRYLPFITVPAFAFSVWLVYLMFFVIEALCLYCLISATTTTLLMLLSFRLRKLDKS
ncbi:MAG: vitamin K epoxide reductase family protein [Balneolaceae bacterium]